MTRKPLIYIAGPYTSGDVARNVARAIEAADEIMEDGRFAVYVPHLSHFWHLHRAHEWEFWMALDQQVLMRCDGLVRLDGESVGADREESWALELGLRLYASVKSLLDGWE